MLEFGPNGEFIGEVGKGLYGWAFAHSVRIDRDDNIWAIDKGSDMIIKFNPQGRVLWVFGRRQESVEEDAGPHEHVDPPLAHVDGLFRQPTDVAWDSAGNTYISDGYINSRVAKYDRNGDWVKSWGEKGTAPGQFNLPHAIAIDRNNNVYVGDRTNRRIQVFDTEGKFLRMFTIDVPPVAGTKAVNGVTPTGARLAQVIGAAQFAVHQSQRQPGAVCRRVHIPGAHLQGLAGWQSDRRHRPLRAQSETVLRRARDRMSDGKRNLHRGNLELARAEGRAPPVGNSEPDPQHSRIGGSHEKTCPGNDGSLSGIAGACRL